MIIWKDVTLFYILNVFPALCKYVGNVRAHTVDNIIVGSCIIFPGKVRLVREDFIVGFSAVKCVTSVCLYITRFFGNN